MFVNIESNRVVLIETVATTVCYLTWVLIITFSNITLIALYVKNKIIISVLSIPSILLALQTISYYLKICTTNHINDTYNNNIRNYRNDIDCSTPPYTEEAVVTINVADNSCANNNGN